MNQQGLYWPNGRNLFRHRARSRLRMALWLVSAAALTLATVGTLYLR